MHAALKHLCLDVQMRMQIVGRNAFVQGRGCKAEYCKYMLHADQKSFASWLNQGRNQREEIECPRVPPTAHSNNCESVVMSEGAKSWLAIRWVTIRVCVDASRGKCSMFLVDWFVQTSMPMLRHGL